MRGYGLHCLGIAAVLIGTVLICTGAARIAGSPEFLAAYRIRQVESIYHGRALPPGDIAYFQREAHRLRSGSARAGVGLGLFLAGILVARCRPSRRSTRRIRKPIAVFSKDRVEIARRRLPPGQIGLCPGGYVRDRSTQ